MKKTFTKMFLLGAAMAFGVNVASAETTTAGVKMTYVNYNDADKAYGEITTGETAMAGYNEIKNGQVTFPRPDWSVSYLTYLQVDASAVDGNIISATLSFDVSGSTDNKRTTEWGLGYNSSVWSSDMTYNTADKSITTFGSTLKTTSKSASKFNNLTFDIADAIKASENGIITILVYETAAGGGYIKNPVVEVEWTNAAAYSVTFTETNGVKAEVTVNGSNVTNGTNLVNGTYNFTATAVGYNDYNGEFTVNGADLNVEYTMTAKSEWNYIVNGADADGNVLGKLSEGKGYENDVITYYYPEFFLKEGTLYSKGKNSTNPFFGTTGTLDSENKEFVVKYDGATIADVVFYKEAEEMEGFISRNTNNASIRCSNGLGGTVKDGGSVLLTTLPAGKYKIFGQVWGVEGLTAKVQRNADDSDSEPVDLWSLASTGSLTDKTSEEFELAKETELYVSTEGSDSKRMLDLIYIVKTGDVEADVKVTSINLDKDVIEAEEGTEVQLIATYEPENATNTDFVWSSSNENIATVSQTGLVSILHSGECVITVATADGSVKAECSVSVKSGVTEIESEQAGEMVIYNLMGQRVKNPTKGIYIINGNKVLVK